MVRTGVEGLPLHNLLELSDLFLVEDDAPLLRQLEIILHGNVIHVADTRVGQGNCVLPLAVLLPRPRRERTGQSHRGRLLPSSLLSLVELEHS